MEKSEEIRRVIDRWTRAISEGDVASALGRLSDHPGTVVIGPDPAEWWHGGEIRAVWGRQLEELFGVLSVQNDVMEAWEEGSVGWASVKETVNVDGRTLEGRATYVLRLEQGDWKIVHIHWSLPRANAETLGRTLTVTLEELEKIVQRDRPDLSASYAVDGTVTIVFTDIVDSTTMLVRLGDRAWVEVIRRHNRVIKDATAAHGGKVVETQGDGSMLAFSSARRAVNCAQAIQVGIDREFANSIPPIRIRIGIHTGDAIQEAEQFFGTTVHYAARVASQALGGEVLVSSLVRGLVADGTTTVSFVEGREVELKGLEGRHQLYALASQ